MVTIELSHNDAAVLKTILETDLSDLRMEISHTDRLDFRERLRVRKAVLSKVLDALPVEVGDTM